MANETRWFFARSGQQSGPVTISELKEMIGQGEVGPGDLVWHEGMGAWTPAGKTLELAVNPAVPAPAADAAAAEIGYYAPAMGIPERALLNLRGHARPTGDTGDWPLDDQRLNQFHGALRLRKKVTSAASLYRLMLYLAVISFVIFFIVTMATLFGSRGGATMGMYMMTPVTGIMLGFSLLYFFAERATRRSQRWAPLTMFIVFVISAALQVFSVVLTANARGVGQPVPEAASLVVVLIFAVAFAAVSWKAFAAIPRYLAQPAWCQELIVKAGL